MLDVGGESCKEGVVSEESEGGPSEVVEVWVLVFEFIEVNGYSSVDSFEYAVDMDVAEIIKCICTVLQSILTFWISTERKKLSANNLKEKRKRM